MTAGQLTTPQHHVHVPHLPHRTVLVAGVAVAVTVAIATIGFVSRPAPVTAPAAPYTTGHGDLAMPGEFLLGLGNAQPVGVAVALPPSLYPMPGEFRLGPGLNQPPGVINPLARPMSRVEPLYAAGEFGLAPGNTAPLGVVVPLYDVPAPGEFLLGPGNTAPLGIPVPLTVSGA